MVSGKLLKMIPPMTRKIHMSIGTLDSMPRFCMTGHLFRTGQLKPFMEAWIQGKGLSEAGMVLKRATI
jgi:hypothetical protein